MQVKCSKCSEPIALTDTIKSSDGRLSHIDCKRTHVLTPEERALVFVYCSYHPVAYCLPCNEKYRFTELGADVFGSSRTNVCPRCRGDLTEQVRAHLYGCAMLPAEMRRRAQAVREAARYLVKQSQELRNKADVLIREAESALCDRLRALREAMSRRTAS